MLYSRFCWAPTTHRTRPALVRVAGIEPAMHRLKVYCHTTWLHAHNDFSVFTL